MSNTGWLTPTTIVDDASVGTVTWSNPGNASTLDGVSATAALNNSTSHWLKATDFGAAIPIGATIQGIEVALLGYGDDFMLVEARIVKGGTISTTSLNDYLQSNTSPVAYIYGNSQYLWGETLTPANINATNFGFVINANETIAFSFTASTDLLTIKIYYSETADTNTGYLVSSTFAEDSSGTLSWGARPTSDTTANNRYPWNGTYINNNRHSTNAGSSAGSTNIAQFTNVNNFVPSGATINGIEVRIQAGAGSEFASTVHRFNTVRLIKGGVISGTNKDSTTHLSIGLGTYYTYGNSTDMWGLTLTDTDVNASNFGVSCSFYMDAGDTQWFELNTVEIIVYHSAAGGGTDTSAMFLVL